MKITAKKTAKILGFLFLGWLTIFVWGGLVGQDGWWFAPVRIIIKLFV